MFASKLEDTLSGVLLFIALIPIVHLSSALIAVSLVGHAPHTYNSESCYTAIPLVVYVSCRSYGSIYLLEEETATSVHVHASRSQQSC